jgi:hypothetical protein
MNYVHHYFDRIAAHHRGYPIKHLISGAIQAEITVFGAAAFQSNTNRP